MLMEVSEVATKLGVTPATVRALERSGRLKAVIKTSRGLRLFHPKEVERLIKEREARLNER